MDRSTHAAAQPPKSSDSPDTSETGEYSEYRLLAESIPNLAWIAKWDGWIFWYNRRWYEYTGTNPQQMEGWGWQSVHDPARLPDVLARWQLSIASGEPLEMTFPLKGADGQFRMFLTRVVPVKDEHGNILRWFGTNTDISEERRVVAALRASEQRFRTATEAVSGILWTNDVHGEMQGEQPGWSGFTGQTQAQYQGYGWASAVHPEDAQPTISAWQQSVSKKSLFSFEHRVRRFDGIYRLCSIRALPVKNEAGEILEWVGVHTDITEDREMELALRASVTALRQQQELVEAAQLNNNAGFWRYEPKEREMYLSTGSRRLLGLPATGPLTLHDVHSVIHPEDQSRVLGQMDEALQSGEYRQEYRTVSPAEPTRWILSVARCLLSADGDRYLVGMHTDITQQKQNSEALIRTEKLAAAGKLAATIAHEINNPLEAVTNLLYLLSHSSLSEEQRAYCVTMADELRRVSEIATHTLRFHRQSSRPSQTYVEDSIRSVVALFDGRLRNAAVTTKSRFRNSRQVFVYEGEIRQVLANLIGNAVDAMNGSLSRKTLLLRTREGTHGPSQRPGVFITVADTGPGISPSARKRIFEPFFSTKGEVGTGLGLWVSSEIISKHQGVLRFRSSYGQAQCGTVFRLFLPMDGIAL